MRIKNPAITADYVRSILEYDRETGAFWWKVYRANKAVAGSRAGCRSKSHGYIVIKINSLAVLAHRLAWLYMTGEWPAHEVDHRDLNRANNAWSNLRQATHGQNQSNGRPYRNNKTGLKGAYPHSRRPGKFIAKIRSNSVLTTLGVFDTAVAAHAAYVIAAEAKHGEFRRIT